MSVFLSIFVCALPLAIVAYTVGFVSGIQYIESHYGRVPTVHKVMAFCVLPFLLALAGFLLTAYMVSNVLIAVYEYVRCGRKPIPRGKPMTPAHLRDVLGWDGASETARFDSEGRIR